MGCFGRILLQVLVVLFFIALWMYGDGVRQKNDAEVPLSTISFGDLQKSFGGFANSTDLQKKEWWKQYSGKKVKWSGHVRSVSPVSESIARMFVSINAFASDVSVVLNESEIIKQ
jgi:hypothetical protein